MVSHRRVRCKLGASLCLLLLAASIQGTPWPIVTAYFHKQDLAT